MAVKLLLAVRAEGAKINSKAEKFQATLPGQGNNVIAEFCIFQTRERLVTLAFGGNFRMSRS